MALVTARFCERDALAVARDLLGCELRYRSIRVRICETEAYRYPDDSACHNRHGITDRNRAIWGPPGFAYVYLCYGIHRLLNVVTNPDGQGAAVLIRACEPIAGQKAIAKRRGDKKGPALLNGPGKVTEGLGVELRHDGHNLCKRGGLELHRGPKPKAIVTGPRIGIDYANKRDRQAPYRFGIADSAWLSKPFA